MKRPTRRERRSEKPRQKPHAKLEPDEEKRSLMPSRRDVLKWGLPIAAATLLGGTAYVLHRRGSQPGKLGEKPFPKLRVTFAFAPHFDEYDAEHLNEIVQREKPDVIALEHTIGPWEEYVKLDSMFPLEWQKIKTMSFEERERLIERVREFWEKSDAPIKGFLYGMEALRIREGVPAIRLENLSSDELKRYDLLHAPAFELVGAAMDSLAKGRLDEAIELHKKSAESTLKMDDIKEASVVNEINSGAFLKRVLEVYPHLKDKNEVNVVIQLGMSHSELAHRIKHPGRAYYQSSPEIEAFLEYPRQLHPSGWLKPERQPATPESLAQKLLLLEIVSKLNQQAPIHVKLAYATVLARQFKLGGIRKLVSNKGVEPGKLDSALKAINSPGLTATEEQMKEHVVKHFRRAGFPKSAFSIWSHDLPAK